MSIRQYCVDIDAPEGSHAADLLSVPFSVLHAMLSEAPRPDLGVGFPHWHYEPKTRRGHVGNRLRMVAQSPDRLFQFMMNERLEDLFDSGTLLCGTVAPVPQDAPRARFVRCRLYERAQRAHALGMGDWREDVPAYPGLLVSSASNGQRFRLRIQRLDAPNEAARMGFNRYGLAVDGRPGNIPMHEA